MFKVQIEIVDARTEHKFVKAIFSCIKVARGISFDRYGR